MTTTDDVTTPPAPRPGHHRRRRRRPAMVVTAVAVAGGLAALLLAGIGDDGEGDEVVSGTATTAVEPTTTTDATSPAVPGTTATTVAVDRSAVIWPTAGVAPAPDDPVDAARRFAESYLGFTAPRVGPFRQGDSRSGEVDVRPVDDGPVTTILVRQASGDRAWSVLGAATPSIEVATPGAGDEIGAPATVAGRAFTFEGHVTVEVRQDGRADPAGKGFVTGGGDEMRPFTGEVSVAPGPGGYGAVVFLTHSAEDGRVWQAAARRVRLRPGVVDPAACGGYRSPRHGLAATDMEVKVFFTCEPDGTGDAVPYPVYRAVPRSTALLRSSLEALLAGPNPTERAAAIGSWFSEATRPLLRSVTVTGGHAVVDFGDLRPVMAGADSGTGSRLLLSELDATVFQFPSVTSAEYRLLGSCEAFADWHQSSGCERRTRETLASE